MNLLLFGWKNVLATLMEKYRPSSDFGFKIGINSRCTISTDPNPRMSSQYRHNYEHHHLSSIDFCYIIVILSPFSNNSKPLYICTSVPDPVYRPHRSYSKTNYSLGYPDQEPLLNRFWVLRSQQEEEETFSELHPCSHSPLRKILNINFGL